jgi:uncharacterized membrane protein YheB (UPF0754 family)
MKKRETLILLDNNIELCINEIQSDITNIEKNIKINIKILFLKDFSEYIKKEKAFKLKINAEEFCKLLSETLDEISLYYTEHLKVLVNLEKSTGIDIIKEEIKKSRNRRNNSHV